MAGRKGDQFIPVFERVIFCINLVALFNSVQELGPRGHIRQIFTGRVCESIGGDVDGKNLNDVPGSLACGRFDLNVRMLFIESLIQIAFQHSEIRTRTKPVTV